MNTGISRKAYRILHTIYRTPNHEITADLLDKKLSIDSKQDETVYNLVTEQFLKATSDEPVKGYQDNFRSSFPYSSFSLTDKGIDAKEIYFDQLLKSVETRVLTWAAICISVLSFFRTLHI